MFYIVLSYSVSVNEITDIVLKGVYHPFFFDQINLQKGNFKLPQTYLELTAGTRTPIGLEPKGKLVYIGN